jgi:ubiquinol oxidase
VLVAQGAFYIGYFGLYLASRRTAHRLVGYFEEEAVLSYTLYLDELESGRMPNPPAPAIAQHYWKLAASARLADVVRAVRADEAVHRDVNHGLATALAQASLRSSQP